MAERAIPDAVNKIFAILTAEFEDASAIAASAQSVQNRRQVKRAARHLSKQLFRIEARLGEIESLLK